MDYERTVGFLRNRADGIISMGDFRRFYRNGIQDYI